MKRFTLPFLVALVLPLAMVSTSRADRGLYVATYILELKTPEYPSDAVPEYAIVVAEEGPYDATTAAWRAQQIIEHGVCSTWTSRCYPAHRVQYVEQSISPHYYPTSK